jgi:hypothetical protein
VIVLMGRNKINRIGETRYNNYGSKMTIVDYTDCENIFVQFETGNIVKTQYINFIKGNVKNIYDDNS